MSGARALGWLKGRGLGQQNAISLLAPSPVLPTACNRPSATNGSLGPLLAESNYLNLLLGSGPGELIKDLTTGPTTKEVNFRIYMCFDVGEVQGESPQSICVLATDLHGIRAHHNMTPSPTPRPPAVMLKSKQ